MDWYDANKRTLPWRVEKPDPYHVWLSEIMLQQTTVATVIPYFEDFLRLWPNVAAMAAADLDEILHAWQGLGYYARARNLHKCATVIASAPAGQFPDTESQLLALPGIGPYTAAAVAAIAFNQPTVPVDGNIERVISRLYAIDEPVRQSKDRVQALAMKLLPKHRAGDFAQALMDLGATVCRPKSPHCDQCPWAMACKAHKMQAEEGFPVKPPKKQMPTRHGVAFWLENADGAIWMRRRPEKGLLGGMVEVPSTNWREQPWTEAEAREVARLNVEWVPREGTVRHTFTHFHLVITVWGGVITGNSNADGFWQQRDRFSELALPTLMKKIVRHASS
ncbi:MAG: A/G-specific adenine glycosylase [Rhodospirillales bacterium]|nr:A/G-specific adenine glycosylase [Rhodospirillales bacterium]